MDALLSTLRADLANGGKLRDAQTKLKAAAHCGYDESYDGSLLVVYFPDILVVLGSGGLSAFKKTPI